MATVFTADLDIFHDQTRDRALFTIDRRSRPLKRFKAEPSGKWVGRFLFTKYDGVQRVSFNATIRRWRRGDVSFKLLPLQPFIPSVLNVYHGLITRVACPYCSSSRNHSICEVFLRVFSQRSNFARDDLHFIYSFILVVNMNIDEKVLLDGLSTMIDRNNPSNSNAKSNLSFRSKHR